MIIKKYLSIKAKLIIIGAISCFFVFTTLLIAVYVTIFVPASSAEFLLIEHEKNKKVQQMKNDVDKVNAPESMDAPTTTEAGGQTYTGTNATQTTLINVSKKTGFPLWALIGMYGIETAFGHGLAPSSQSPTCGGRDRGPFQMSFGMLYDGIERMLLIDKSLKFPQSFDYNMAFNGAKSVTAFKSASGYIACPYDPPPNGPPLNLIFHGYGMAYSELLGISTSEMVPKWEYNGNLGDAALMCAYANLGNFERYSKSWFNKNCSSYSGNISEELKVICYVANHNGGPSSPMYSCRFWFPYANAGKSRDDIMPRLLKKGEYSLGGDRATVGRGMQLLFGRGLSGDNATDYTMGVMLAGKSELATWQSTNNNSATPPPNSPVSTGAKGSLAKLFTAMDSFPNVHYVYGANDPACALDCSSYVLNVFLRAFGKHLPRTTSEQVKLGQHVDKKDLQPGDLVFFDTGGSGTPTHVGIYRGNDTFTHNSSGRGKIITVSFSHYISIPGLKFYEARRIMNFN